MGQEHSTGSTRSSHSRKRNGNSVNVAVAAEVTADGADGSGDTSLVRQQQPQPAAAAGCDGSCTAAGSYQSDSTVQLTRTVDGSTTHAVSHHDVQKAIDEGKKIVRGLYDYTSSAESNDGSEKDLNFKKGDFMIVIKEDGDWWYAEHMLSHVCGYIPVTYIAEVNSFRQFEWFHGKILRKEAERLLSSDSNRRGTFLIRESETVTGAYSLSLLDEDQNGARTVKHYRIRDLDQGQGCYINPKKKCLNLEDLVQSYSRQADGLCHVLTQPCPRLKPVMYDMSHATRDHWEISKNSLELQEKVGKGMFGEVWKGVWNRCTAVAIKTLIPGTMAPSKFLQEASIMKKLQHPKLVALFAVCSQEEPIYIVTELMVGGSLWQYLRSELGKTLKLNNLIDVAAQVADGMFYLEKSRFIHRDLAARNILVGEGHTVKIGDFGLARDSDCDLETNVEACKLPIKWTAPEAIRHAAFSVKSDVWSYGILLVELVTYGQTPYPQMTNRQVIEHLDKGLRHPRPADCTEEMYNIMLMCWKKSADERPTFEYLFHTMDDYNVAIASSYAAT